MSLRLAPAARHIYSNAIRQIRKLQRSDIEPMPLRWSYNVCLTLIYKYAAPLALIAKHSLTKNGELRMEN